jgi:hypothetical protein
VSHPWSVNEKGFAIDSKVVELTGFVDRRYHAGVTTPDVADRQISEAGAQLDPEWDEVFSWSYGLRLWNVGCG